MVISAFFKDQNVRDRVMKDLKENDISFLFDSSLASFYSVEEKIKEYGIDKFKKKIKNVIPHYFKYLNENEKFDSGDIYCALLMEYLDPDNKSLRIKDIIDVDYFLGISFWIKVKRETYNEKELLKRLKQKGNDQKDIVDLIGGHFSSKETFEYFLEELDSLTIEDSYRQRLFTNLLLCENETFLHRFLEIAKEKNYLKYKSFDEALRINILDTGTVQPNLNDCTKVLYDILEKNYDKYIYSTNAKLTYIFVCAMVILFKNDYIENACSWFGKGSKQFRVQNNIVLSERFFYLLDTNHQFLMKLDEMDEIEKAALLGTYFYRYDKKTYRLDSKKTKDIIDVLLNVLGDSKFCKTHISVSNINAVLIEVSVSNLLYRIDEILLPEYKDYVIQKLDNLYPSFGWLEQQYYLHHYKDETKLDLRKEYIKLMKWYELPKEYSPLSLQEAIFVSDFLKTKKQANKNILIKELKKVEPQEELISYLLSSKEDYKIIAGEELNKCKNTIEVQEEEYSLKDKCKVIPVAYISDDNINKIIERTNAFYEKNKDVEYDWCGMKYTLAANTFLYEMDEKHIFYSEIKDIFSDIPNDQFMDLFFMLKDVCYDKYRNSPSNLNKLKTYEHYDILASSIDSFFDLHFDEKACLELEFESTINEGNVKRIFEHKSFEKEITDLDNLYKIAFIWKNTKNLIYDRGASYSAIFESLLKYTDIPESIYYEFLLNNGYILKGFTLKMIGDKTNSEYIYQKNYNKPTFKKFLCKFIDTAFDTELERDTMMTKYSKGIEYIKECYNSEFFIRSIVKMRKRPLVRTDAYSFYQDVDRDTAISLIMKTCYPEKDLSLDAFKALIDKYKISEDELIRASVFNIHFIDIVSEYLGYPGYKQTVFYFATHLNENLDNDVIEHIKEYTSIDYRDFKDGAFDFAWYLDLKSKIDSSILKKIYDNAKYITVGANHKRAQRFIDAIENRISIDEAKSSIEKSRNKDYVLAYSLIPIKDKKDLYERYSYLSEFLRQSKSFGQQRQASERRLIDIAFENLARTGGYSDTMQFVCDMECLNNESNTCYNPIDVDGYIVKMIPSFKKIKLVCFDNKGKELKKIPSKVNSNKEVKALNEMIKEEETKRKRLRAMFESAMENESVFSYDTLMEFGKNPLLNVFISSLILLGKKDACIYKDGKIISIISENEVKYESFTIAHPIRLKEENLLAKAISYIVSNNIVQPFKQVLREIYFVNADEKSGDSITRYVGYNINLKKAVGALKSRLWGVSSDLGIRKVYRKDNLIAVLFREFDDFYYLDDADLNRELSKCFFISRDDYKIVKPIDVNPVIYSETLRDIDLMLTVSSNNLYDHELAMGTFDIRRKIVEVIIELLNIKNISFLKENIKIEGTFGNYVVNIKTGLVFKEGVGNIFIKTIENYNAPLLLDFIDEDPMTVDVITKVLMLSNDDLIKDVNILNEIR